MYGDINMISVLIAEDSLTTREYLKHIISSDPNLKIIGEAKDGREAVELAVEKRPDIVIMDIQMPNMNGYEATNEIMDKCPIPIVIYSTLVAPEQTENIFLSMQAGAVAVCQKPPGLGHPESTFLAEKLLRTVKLMSEVRVIRKIKKPKKLPPTKTTPPIISKASGADINIIAIGASTGGPPVLHSILSNLNNNLLIPIIIVQHIAKGFLEGMVDWLSKDTNLMLHVPKTGDKIEKGYVYFAPEDQNLKVTSSKTFHLSDFGPKNVLKRPISYLFNSVANTYKKDAIGVVLTGMGNDGSEGLKEMKINGALTVAQDKESSVVFGMPKEAINLNAATHILSPPEIVTFLNNHCKKNHG